MSDSGRTTDGLEPRPVGGTIPVPVSKSLAQRAIVAATFARGWTLFGELRGLDEGSLREGVAGHRTPQSDLEAAVGFARATSTECTLAEREGSLRLVVEGRTSFPKSRERDRNYGEDRVPWPVLTSDKESSDFFYPVGESGTLARLALACMTLLPRAESRVFGRASGTLRRRRTDALVEALRAAGATFIERRDLTWPQAWKPSAGFDSLELVRPKSSQELSALWLAAAARGGRIPVTVQGDVPSEPYLGLTEQVLAEFGATLEPIPGGGRFDRMVEGPLVAPDHELQIEADASAAAVALAAGCLSGGGVAVEGVDGTSRQGDVRVVEHLRAFGCDAKAGHRALWATGFPTRAAELDLSGEPDLAPVLAAVAGALALIDASSGHSVLTGLHTLPGKESSRIEVLAAGLRALGIHVEATDRSLAIGPGTPHAGPVTLDPHADHRMAFAFALLGLVRPGIRIADPGCVSKSWPSFFEDLRRAQASRPGR